MINQTTLMNNSYFTTGYVNITVNLITGIIPLFTLGILNYRIYKCLLERGRQVTEIATQSASKKLESDKKQANTLFGIVALFFCGHILRIIYNINKPFMMENLQIVKQNHPVNNGICMTTSPIWIQIVGCLSTLFPVIAASGNLIIYLNSNQ